jgi:tRNA nucleotidyltransferase/poly(A) polymerase
MRVMPKIFKVGGCVRDRLLGVDTNDIDFTFVLDNLDRTVEEGFDIMTKWLEHKEFEIFLSTPECFTIRAKFPKEHKYAGMVADFVMARKEVGYVEGTRRPILELGTLEDDLVRRDFTVNAMAEDEDGNLIDLFNGQMDLERMILITPLAPKVTFEDDPLRIIRAIRFSITKGFSLSYLDYFIYHFDYEGKMGVVSIERIREELLKCFKHDTLKTLEILNQNPKLRDYIFKNNILWLKPTFEKIK